ncbi:MAG: branched-chain amino acid ABC transporter permease [Clostridia bacterium]|nr:branched-chain amino acid ABC transporter permease [Clostridia bacterium]
MKMHKLRRLMSVPLTQIILFAALMTALQLLSMAGLIPNSFTYAIGSTLIYAIVAIGFCLLLGYSGLASLGTAGFIGVGAYAAYYVMESFGMPYIAALAVTLAISVAIGVAVGFISLRVEGLYLAILTLGLSEILRNLLMAVQATIKIDISNARLFGVQLNDSGAYMLVLVTFSLLVWLTSNLIDSPTGRAMLAMKNSTSAAQAMGVSLMKHRLLAFVISTVFAAIGGLLYMMYVRVMTTSVSTLLTMTTSLNILGAVIIGGAKSLWGTTLGAFIVYGIQSMFLSKIPFFQKNPAFITMLTGLLIVVVVMFFPGGLTQFLSGIKAKLQRSFRKVREDIYGKDLG